MTKHLLVISGAPLIKTEEGWVGYAPMVVELDLWFEKAEQVTVIAPTKTKSALLSKPLKRQDIKVISVVSLDFTSFGASLKSLINTPIIKMQMLFAMAKADHLHLRAPATLTLLACWLQILFPFKAKTAKYAGNWSPKAKQPFSYKMQKWLLSNTFLTKRMQVLVYGQWPNQTKNIKAFFTATYWEKDKTPISPRDYTGPVKMIYLGTLSANKRVDYAIELSSQLMEQGIDMSLDIYGDGAERDRLESLALEKKLSERIQFKGNQPANTIAQALKEAHFLVLASISEGWPKAVAEAMFWGAIPLASPVSCVPWMLGNGKRGLLLDFETDAETVAAMLTRPRRLQRMADSTQEWSRAYTMDKFREEIHKLLEA